MNSTNTDILRAVLSPVFVYDGVEELAVPPAGGEVVAAQALVSLHHPLRPEQQLLFGRHVVRLAVHLNVWDLKEETVERVSDSKLTHLHLLALKDHTSLFRILTISRNHPSPLIMLLKLDHVSL